MRWSGPVARDLTPGEARAVTRDLTRAFAYPLDRTRAFDLAAPTLALTRRLALARYPEEVLAEAQVHYLEEVESLSLVLMSLSSAESPPATAYRDVYLAAAIAQEQQAGNIPEIAVGHSPRKCQLV